MSANYREADVASQLEALREENSVLRDKLESSVPRPYVRERTWRSNPILGGTYYAGKSVVYVAKHMWSPEFIGGVIVFGLFIAGLFGLVEVLHLFF